jgi:thiol-disulfide isomerase/thioredoxin
MLTLFILASVCVVHAQEIAVVSPLKPKIKDVVTVTYNPSAPGAVHKNAEEIYAVVLTVHIEDLPGFVEKKMERFGDVWKASFTLEDPNAVALLIRFDAGDKIDDNASNAWLTLVHGKNNKPVRGAHYIASILNLQKNYYGFKRTVDTTTAVAMVKQELKMYPESWHAQQWLWTLESGKSADKKTKDRIAKELSAVYAKEKNNETAVEALLRWFVVTDQTAKAEQIESEWLKKNPDGVIAESKWRQEFFKEQNPVKRSELTDQYLSRFKVKRGFENMFISSYIRTKEYDKAIAFLEKHPAVNVNYYNNIAYGLISTNTRLETAVEIARRGLDRASIEFPGSRFDFLSQSRDQWKKNIAYSRGMIGDTYGEGLMKLGKYIEAEPVLEEAQMLIDGEDPDVNARLVECYLKNGRNKKAIDVSYASLVKGKGNDTLLEHYKSAYILVTGSVAGFDSVVAATKIEMKAALRIKLMKEKLDLPSVDFSLKSLDGSTVKLSDLKGKVVVLDFWATWCGPCLASFPSLQKVYDRYKENPNVVILALNTWERVKPDEREQHVKNFMSTNKYTFPVLFDTDIVSRYGVEGIPTKFLIGKNGNIRFKDVGFGGAQEMEDKMELQFEMLLGEDISGTK